MQEPKHIGTILEDMGLVEPTHRESYYVPIIDADNIFYLEGTRMHKLVCKLGEQIVRQRSRYN